MHLVCINLSLHFLKIRKYMNQNKTLSLLVLAIFMALSSAAVKSAGFQQSEYSATGLGRAYAGEAAMADNPAAQFRNPAMLSYLPGTQISTGIVYVDPNIGIDGIVTTATGEKITTSADDFSRTALIPNFYLSHQINEQLFLGFGIASNFGMDTQFEDNFKAIQFGSEMSVSSLEINPNLAYRINEQFSVGAGLRLVKGSASVESKSSGGDLPAGTRLKRVQGDDYSFGWQLGAAWQINPKHRIGLNYRSAINLTLEGEASGSGFGFTGQLPSAMDLILPATSEISSFHQIDEKISVHTSINWTDWNRFKTLETHIPSFSSSPILLKEENWMSTYRFALGGTYQLDEKTRLRAGIAYDLSAVDTSNRSAIIPESNRIWFSVGAGYDYSEKVTFDIGLAYIKLENADIKKPHPCATDHDALGYGGSFTGNISGHILLVGIQASYLF